MRYSTGTKRTWTHVFTVDMNSPDVKFINVTENVGYSNTPQYDMKGKRRAHNRSIKC